MPKIWVGCTTLNGEKKEDGLSSKVEAHLAFTALRSAYGKKYQPFVQVIPIKIRLKDKKRIL